MSSSPASGTHASSRFAAASPSMTTEPAGIVTPEQVTSSAANRTGASAIGESQRGELLDRRADHARVGAQARDPLGVGERVGPHQVDGAGLGQAGEQPVGDLLHPRSPLGHPAHRDRAADQLAQPGVARRVHQQHHRRRRRGQLRPLPGRERVAPVLAQPRSVNASRTSAYRVTSHTGPSGSPGAGPARPGATPRRPGTGRSAKAPSNSSCRPVPVVVSAMHPWCPRCKRSLTSGAG